MAMEPKERGESFLFNQFHEFYGEVIALKQLVDTGAWAFTKEAVEEERATYRDKVMTSVWEKIVSVMERHQLTAMQMGAEYWTPLYKEAQYIMVALADEIFIHLDWEGREIWKSNLLESRFFKSHIAGELFFEKVDRLLQNRDPAHTGIAKLYLLALALGFQGKFRGAGNGASLYGYRRRLFYFIARRDPGILTESRRLFPEAYAYTLEGGKEKRLPDTRKWMLVLVAVIAVYFLAQHWIWTGVTSNLNEVIAKILVGQ